jgi:hypothetical protein
MREYRSEPMKPGPFVIIINTFPLLLLAFLILDLFKSENFKNAFTFCNYTENPQTNLLYNISFSLFSIIYFSAIYFISLY